MPLDGQKEACSSALNLSTVVVDNYVGKPRKGAISGLSATIFLIALIFCATNIVFILQWLAKHPLAMARLSRRQRYVFMTAVDGPSWESGRAAPCGLHARLGCARDVESARE
jgi:hypothetical protein